MDDCIAVVLVLVVVFYIINYFCSCVPFLVMVERIDSTLYAVEMKSSVEDRCGI